MAAPVPAYSYAAKLIRVIDGDTYEFLIDLGCQTYTREMIRLRNYGSKETNQSGGNEAREWAIHVLTQARFIVVVLFRTSTSDQNDPKFVRTFVRYVADVWVDDTPMYEAMGEFVHQGKHEGVPHALIPQRMIG